MTGARYPALLTRPDQTRYYSLVPNAQGWALGEDSIFVTLNRLGYWDRNHTIRRPPACVRVAILGDSMTASLHVTLENSFPQVAERAMRSRLAASKTIPEVMNFGVMGYSTAQSLFTLRQDVWQFDPQIVVLVMTPTWSVYHNTRATYWTETIPYPYYEYVNGHLQPDELTQRHLRSKRTVTEPAGWFVHLVNTYRLPGMIRAAQGRAGRGWQRIAQRVRSLWDHSLPESEMFRVHEYDAMRPPATEALREDWRVTEGLLLMMNGEVEAHGAEFWIAIGDTGAEAHPSEAFREKFRKENGLGTLSYADDRVLQFAASHGIRAFKLADALEFRAVETGKVLHFDPVRGHWNGAGHQVVGETIAEHLVSGSRFFPAGAEHSFPKTRRRETDSGSPLRTAAVTRPWPR